MESGVIDQSSKQAATSKYQVYRNGVHPLVEKNSNKANTVSARFGCWRRHFQRADVSTEGQCMDGILDYPYLFQVLSSLSW